jgi:AcrR family transcriptional regulator
VTDVNDSSAPAPASSRTPPAATDRGRRRREVVLDAAEALFLEHGFHGTSMDELGAAAGISGPGLYRHYPSKDALLMAVLDRIWDTLAPAIAEADTLDPGPALDVLLDAQLELACGQPAALVLLLRELRHLPDDYRALAQRNHQRYVDAWTRALRGVHPGLDHAAARGMVLAVHGLIDSSALRPQLDTGLSLDEQRQLLGRLARAVVEVTPP